MATATISAGSALSQQVQEFVTRDFTPHYGELDKEFGSDPLWQSFLELDTELWLDSGNFEAVEGIWTREYSGLTTNNTLLSKEIVAGAYDELILQAADLLSQFPDLTARQFRLEMAFILNAVHALRLVERFDAHVSVEEHTDLAHDFEESVEYARRYYAICPERFYIKIPFTPAGVLATRRVRQEGIPVNHTLGFSARQNYVVTRLASPSFVNVFLGRLNSLIVDNGLGNGDYVGEKATLASQRAIRSLRERGFETRQIGASFRSYEQYLNLAGIDVITSPPNVARELLDRRNELPHIESQIDQNYVPGIAHGEADHIGLDTLWRIDDKLVACVDALDREDLDSFNAETLVNFFESHGCSDFLVRWSNPEIALSAAEGKIPKLSNWADQLSDGSIGLDSLMNLAGFNSFATDQKKMDSHVMNVLSRTDSHSDSPRRQV